MYLNIWLGNATGPNSEMTSLLEAFSLFPSKNVFPAVFYMILFYIFYFLKPKIFAQRNYGYKIGAILLLFMISNVIYLQTLSKVGQMYALRTISTSFSISLITAILGTLSRFAIDWISLKIKSDELQKQNLQGELRLLKNQINPHFFFNTLNNIDSLIKSNADKASAILVKLGEIMRYMIYETKDSFVPLSNEIKHIENYVDLQRIQFSNKNFVSFSASGSPDQISIAPVLFISFVENAFKHCTNKEANGAIKIRISVSDKLIDFECVNLYSKAQTLNKDEASGVGLDNVKRRLELLYPKKHKLKIIEEDDCYKVALKIDTHVN